MVQPATHAMEMEKLLRHASDVMGKAVIHAEDAAEPVKRRAHCATDKAENTGNIHAKLVAAQAKSRINYPSHNNLLS